MQLKVQLFADDTEKVDDLWQQFPAMEFELASRRSAFKPKKTTSVLKDRECSEFHSDPISGLAAVCRGGKLIHNFSGRISIRSTSLVRTKATSYRNRFDAMLTDAQVRVTISVTSEFLLGKTVISSRLW